MTYTGPTVHNISSSNSIDMGIFAFNSVYTTENIQGSFFVSHANSYLATSGGLFKVTDNVRPTTVPAAVPLPSSSLMGLGLLGVMGGVYAFRRTRTA